MTALERFQARIAPQPNGCALWLGPLVRGTPDHRLDGERLNARRVAWYLAYGEMPGKTFTTCNTRLCVAVEHIRLPFEPRILALLDEGQTITQVARALGVDHAWVSRVNAQRGPLEVVCPCGRAFRVGSGMGRQGSSRKKYCGRSCRFHYGKRPRQQTSP